MRSNAATENASSQSIAAAFSAPNVAISRAAPMASWAVKDGTTDDGGNAASSFGHD